jgi:uncharacterized protein involved in exopolysaccharide biosynthesis
MQDEIEIDIRKYIQVILSIVIRNWYWILGAAVICTAIVFLTTAKPLVYEATALVSITQPRYVYNLDPLNQVYRDIQPNYNAYPQLAKSDDILVKLNKSWKNKPEGLKTTDDLRDILSANLGADYSLLQLTVTLQDPKQAAELANLWASIVVEKIRDVYGGNSPDQAQSIQDQVDASQKNLQDAEKTLTDFQAENQTNILNNQLASLLQMQSEYLARQRNITYLQQDVRAMKQQLTGQLESSKTSLIDQSALTYLQVRVFNSLQSLPLTQQLVSGSPDSVPSIQYPQSSNSSIQFQLGNSGIAIDTTVGDQMEILNNLEKVLDAQENDISSHLMDLIPQILISQQKYQEMKTQEDHLNKAVELAQDTYTTVSKRMQEVLISSKNNGGEFQLASTASVPLQQKSQHRLRYAGLAGVAAAVLVIVFLALVEWWRGVSRLESVSQKILE